MASARPVRLAALSALWIAVFVADRATADPTPKRDARGEPPTAVRDLLTPERLAGLQAGPVDYRTADAADMLWAHAARGRDALAWLFSGAPPRLALLATPPPLTVTQGERVRIEAAILNVGAEAGWTSRPHDPSLGWQPRGRFGRWVNLRRPEGSLIGIGGSAGGYFSLCGPGASFERVAPGALASYFLVAEGAAPEPGLWSVAARARFRDASWSNRDSGSVHPNWGRRGPPPEAKAPVAAFVGDLSSDPVGITVLPSEGTRSTAVAGARLDVTAVGRALRVHFFGRPTQCVPSDLGSAWYVLLDGAGDAVDYGCLDGRPPTERTYNPPQTSALSPEGISFSTDAPRRAATGTWEILVGADVFSIEEDGALRTVELWSRTALLSSRETDDAFFEARTAAAAEGRKRAAAPRRGGC